jgi:hypothetical protein
MLQALVFRLASLKAKEVWKLARNKALVGGEHEDAERLIGGLRLKARGL